MASSSSALTSDPSPQTHIEYHQDGGTRIIHHFPEQKDAILVLNQIKSQLRQEIENSTALSSDLKNEFLNQMTHIQVKPCTTREGGFSFWLTPEQHGMLPRSGETKAVPAKRTPDTGSLPPRQTSSNPWHIRPITGNQFVYCFHTREEMIGAFNLIKARAETQSLETSLNINTIPLTYTKSDTFILTLEQHHFAKGIFKHLPEVTPSYASLPHHPIFARTPTPAKATTATTAATATSITSQVIAPPGGPRICYIHD